MISRLTGSWRGRFALGLAAMIIALVSLTVLSDATTFALYGGDPESGRIMGCYVILEFWIGATRPTSWARTAELAASSALLLLSVAIAVRAARGSDGAPGASPMAQRIAYGCCVIALVLSALDIGRGFGVPSTLAFLMAPLMLGAYTVTRRVWSFALVLSSGFGVAQAASAAEVRRIYPMRNYADHAAASADSANGPWTTMPTWMPGSARDITIIWSTRLSEHWLVFRAPPEALRNSFHEGRRVPADQLGAQFVNSPPRSVEWPDVVTRAARGDTGTVYVRHHPPDRRPMCVYVEWASGRVYAWTCSVQTLGPSPIQRRR